jgi:hypothetical protein
LVERRRSDNVLNVDESFPDGQGRHLI